VTDSDTALVVLALVVQGSPRAAETLAHTVYRLADEHLTVSRDLRVVAIQAAAAGVAPAEALLVAEEIRADEHQLLARRLITAAYSRRAERN